MGRLRKGKTDDLEASDCGCDCDCSCGCGCGCSCNDVSRLAGGFDVLRSIFGGWLCVMVTVDMVVLMSRYVWIICVCVCLFAWVGFDV